jgi:NADH dehydrogenase
MRVVVAGGTGFIGRSVVNALLAREGVHVAVTTRDLSSPDPWGGRVERVQAFAGDPVSLGRAFTRRDVIVQAIQFPNHPVEDPSRGYTYLEVDGRGTGVAADVARRLGVRKFVYLSGAGAGEGRPQRWFRAKDMAEAAVREAGLEHVFLRPSWVYGPGDRSMSWFVLLCRHLPLVPVLGDGRPRVWPLHVGDLARCVADSVLREDLTETALEMGGPAELTMDDVVRTIQKVLGRRRPLVHQPIFLAKLGARMLAFLPKPPLSPGAVDFVTQDVPIDPRPAHELFGGRFRALEEGLREDLGARG